MSDVSALNLQAGEVVGGYTLVSRLGSGAMGSVWRVHDDGGHEYAMKILRDSLAEEDELDGDEARERLTARERLRREAMALRKINHPGVCQIVDMELDDALAFIVTELIDGRNLREDVAENGRYEGNDLERLATKLIDAVRAVHAAGIVHRDIKPTNVMVSAAGPVLVDFGIAMTGGESHVTRTGLVMGTPGFIAPEIIDGVESDETSDWWSVASVLAFAAMGEPVFGTKPMMAVLERAAAGSANLSGLPAHTMAAFRSALAPDRSQRCTPDQLLHAIALDALDPFGWGAGADGAGGESSDNPTDAPVIPPTVPPTVPPTGVMRPFDGAGPRGRWSDDGLDATAALDPALCTVPLPSDTLSATRVMPSETADAPSATTVMPGSAETREVSSQPHAPATPLAVPPGMLPPAPLSMSQTTIMPGSPAAAPVASPPAPPTWGMAADGLAPAVGINPADTRRAEYLRNAWRTTLLLALPSAAAGCFHPLAAIAVALILSWLLLTLGCGVEATLERERRRGGAHRWSDSAMRVAAFPWHLTKGLLLALPRTLLIAIEYLALLGLAALTLDLPWIEQPVGFWPGTLPMLTDGPFSLTGLACAICAALTWTTGSLWPRSSLSRLGAGSLWPFHRTQPPQPTPLAES